MRLTDFARRVINHHNHNEDGRHPFREEDFKKLQKCCSENKETPICRPVFNQAHFDDFHEQIVKEKASKSELAKKAVKRHFDSDRMTSRLMNFVPIISWLRNYDLKNDLIADLICGLTVVIFHVPQTLGYSLIVGVPAINGLYTALFPMLMYTIFGTSRHNSIGAFAVVCVMTGGIVVEAAQELPHIDAVTVVSTLAFFVGIFQFIMGLLNMGGLSVFLSEQFVSGFTAGVSFHIGSSQIGGLFGFNVKKFAGAFLLIQTYVDFFKRIGETHLPTLGFAVVTICIILAVKIYIDPYLLKKFRMPLPIEMIVVIISVILSRTLDLEDKGFYVVKDIPNSLQAPALPSVSVELVKFVLADSVLIAIISFTVAVSLGRIWARERKYEIQPNQEFFALGLSNFFGSFFGCFPVGASVPRSSLQLLGGGRTQLVSVINSSFMLIIILALGRYLDGIPKVALSAIIVVSLKKVFMQVKDFKNFWDLSIIDGQVWLVSFFATVIIDVVSGLIIGVVFSLLTLVYKIQRPKTFLLGAIPNSDYYVPIHLYAQAREVPGVKIFQYGGPLHFANAEFFKSELLKKSSKDFRVADQVNPKATRYIILDVSRITFIDGSSAIFLKQLIESIHEKEITVFIACCAPTLMKILEKAELLETISKKNFYPSVHDAVMHTFEPKHHHRHLDSLGRQASFSETFGPDSLKTEIHEFSVDISDETNGHFKL